MTTVRLAVVVAVAMAGCAAKPPERLVTPAPISRSDAGMLVLEKRPRSVAAERPDIGLAIVAPDPEHELRWPLSVSVHPTLEPSFAIAQELAEPGLDWIALCRMGSLNRYGGGKLRDLMTYLRAWCAVESGDLDGGLGALASLQTSVTRGLGPAVRTDILSVLAAGDADQAQKLMNKYKLFDLDRLDRLAATYVELGKPDDAYAINTRAIQSDRVADHASSCRRLARGIMLGPEDLRDVPLQELRTMAAEVTADPECVELYRDLSCWTFIMRTRPAGITSPLAHCGAYWVHGNVPVEQRPLLDAYLNWPKSSAPAWQWLDVANKATQALTIDGADHLAVRAFEAAVEASNCEGDVVREASSLANRLFQDPARKKTVDDARFLRLVYRPDTICAGQ